MEVGDRVVAPGSGCFATSQHVSGQCCRKIPDSLRFVDAATMPIVYCTVMYGLENVAHLQKDQVCTVFGPSWLNLTFSRLF